MRPGSPICFLALLYYLILIYPIRGIPVVPRPSSCNRNALPQTSIELVTSFVFTTLPGSVAVEIVVEIEDPIPTFTQTTNPVDIGPTSLGATEAAFSPTGSFLAFPAPKTFPMASVQTADTASATIPILTGPPRQPTTLLMEMTSTTPPLTEVGPPTTAPGHPQATTQPTGSAALVSSSKSDSAEAAWKAIIGGVCGGLVLIGCAVCLFERRRRKRITGRPFVSDSSRLSSFASYAGKLQLSDDLMKTHVEPYIIPALNMGDKFILKASNVDEAARMKSRLEKEAIREEPLEGPSRGMLAAFNPDTPPEYDDLGDS